MNIEEIKRIAINEILNPTFEITKQFLSVNRIVFNNNVPEIEDVIMNDETAEVYFPIVDESYFFVLYVDCEPFPSLRFMNTSPGNHVYLFATSETNSLDELLNILSIEPTDSWRVGERKKFTKAENYYKNSGFEFAPVSKRTGEAEDKLNVLINILHEQKDKMPLLREIADVGLQVDYYGYKEQMWGVFLKPETLRKLADLNISLDIELYAGGPDLPE
ncbi:MAG TPA: DUF4279 domain-containing protein [Clostridia bacterium]